MDCKIISFTDSWRNKLRDYLHKVFPSYSNEYINYCINHSADRLPSLLVINEDNCIVGCHLFFCTKVMLNGEMIDTQWGHNTFLDKEYRGKIGLDFVLTTYSKKSFGIGLTDVNEKIQKLLKEVFFKGVYNYYLVTFSFILSPLQLIFRLKPVIKTPEKIKISKYIFRRIKDAAELNIPNEGFWNQGKIDIDFIRDSSFINERFLKNQVYQYYLYALDTDNETCYLVIRQISYRGVPAIALADYRYTHKKLLRPILQVVIRLACISHFGIVLFLSGDDNMEAVVKGKIHYKTKVDFVTNMKLKPDLTYIVTGGDSDADFLK